MTLQMVAKDHGLMDNIMDVFEEKANANNIEINEGTGPAFEDPVVKMIHQDRVR